MIGKTIGNYQVSGELAQGGMGAVYRGRHISLPRDVVVKSILLASFPPQHQEPLKARFLREAYIQSQLDHPNIVRVYEFFTSAENYYLVMEFIDGMSMRDLIRRQGALDPAHAIGLLKQSLAALDYAHNFSYLDESGKRYKGIVHRDIKPANLLLDGMARLKITDFGIVKLTGERGMTRTGFNPGTVEYMSPEQIRGHEVDPRSDLYSLGVTFYQALTGRLPFPQSDTGSEYDVLRGHIELPPPSIASIRPDVPPRLESIIMRTLAKKPEDRYQSAAEFLDALIDYERGREPGEQITHSMTELIQETGPFPSAPATGSPQPSIETNVIPKSDSDPAVPVPRTGSSSRTGMIAALGLAALLIAAAAGYFLLGNGGEASNAPVQPATDQAASQAPAVSQVESDQLREARASEEREDYPEAIRLYDEYVKSNPGASDATARKTEALKKLQGLLTIAELELSQDDFAAAKRDFTEALKLRPESKRAQKGLEDAEKGLAAQR
ncbi:MAG: protein kinase [Acidobacteriota bacterium]|nr:MAG: protein kinase [Acidobacteriota bacterium]